MIETLSISINETVGLKELNAIIAVFTEALNLNTTSISAIIEGNVNS